SSISVSPSPISVSPSPISVSPSSISVSPSPISVSPSSISGVHTHSIEDIKTTAEAVPTTTTTVETPDGSVIPTSTVIILVVCLLNGFLLGTGAVFICMRFRKRCVTCTKPGADNTAVELQDNNMNSQAQYDNIQQHDVYDEILVRDPSVIENLNYTNEVANPGADYLALEPEKDYETLEPENNNINVGTTDAEYTALEHNN
ncbi:unnamed protein product, partial [Owenia fusiformis]